MYEKEKRKMTHTKKRSNGNVEVEKSVTAVNESVSAEQSKFSQSCHKNGLESRDMRE